MITEHQEIARYQIAEQLRAAEARALRRQAAASRTEEWPVSAPRRTLAGVLRRLADRLEPRPRARRTGLSVVR